MRGWTELDALQLWLIPVQIEIYCTDIKIKSIILKIYSSTWNYLVAHTEEIKPSHDVLKDFQAGEQKSLLRCIER